MHVPLYVDVRGWRILVFGAGSVGVRRAELFLEAGASRIVMAAKEFSEKAVRLAEKDRRVELVKLVLPGMEDEFEKLAREADLVVIASSSPQANRVATAIARRTSRLVNNATSAGDGNVVIPFRATLYGGGVHIAVTSLGATGIAARRVLEKIIECLEGDRELETLYRVMARLKEYMKKHIPSAKDRVPLYFEIERDPVFAEHVRRGREKEAYERGLEIICTRIGGCH